MLFRTVFFLFCFQVIFYSFTKDKNGIVYWTKERKLSWEDFKGEPNDYSFNSAESCLKIYFTERKMKDSVVFYVNAIFFQDRSWVKLYELKDTPFESQGIKHEQGHFDISEIYSRKLRKLFSQTSFSENELLNGRSNFICDSIEKECFKFQQLYDDETTHGGNNLQQIEWQNKIEIELKEWEKFSNPRICSQLIKK